MSIIYFNKKKFSFKIELIILSLIGIPVFFATERTALFLLFIIYFSYFLISEKRLFFLSIVIIIFSLLFASQKTITTKYIFFTLEQTGLNLLKKPNRVPLNNDLIRYYSYEHENLSYTGLKAFQKNFLFGTGVKSFYFYCRDTVKKYQYMINKRNNKLVCSTHPHNTYVQILSEIGIFGFIMILIFFMSVLIINLKILLNKNKNNLIKSYFFINLSIIVNLMPLIPSGSFFNNWISLMIFFPLGFLLYMRDNIKN